MSRPRQYGVKRLGRYLTTAGDERDSLVFRNLFRSLHSDYDYRVLLVPDPTKHTSPQNSYDESSPSATCANFPVAMATKHFTKINLGSIATIKDPPTIHCFESHRDLR